MRGQARYSTVEAVVGMDPATNEEVEMARYTVRFVNHGYSMGETFESAADAIVAGKRAHFDFAVERDGVTVAGWDAIGGLRWYFETERAFASVSAAETAKLAVEKEARS